MALGTVSPSPAQWLPVQRPAPRRRHRRRERPPPRSPARQPAASEPRAPPPACRTLPERWQPGALSSKWVFVHPDHSCPVPRHIGAAEAGPRQLVAYRLRRRYVGDPSAALARTAVRVVVARAPSRTRARVVPGVHYVLHPDAWRAPRNGPGPLQVRCEQSLLTFAMHGDNVSLAVFAHCRDVKQPWRSADMTLLPARGGRAHTCSSARCASAAAARSSRAALAARCSARLARIACRFRRSCISTCRAMARRSHRAEAQGRHLPVCPLASHLLPVHSAPEQN